MGLTSNENLSIELFYDSNITLGEQRLLRYYNLTRAGGIH
jgi:hypothetical protein